MKKSLCAALGLSLLVPSVGTFTLGNVQAAAPVKTPAVKTVEWTETKAPRTLYEMASEYSNSTVTVTYADGKKVSAPLKYETLFRTDAPSTTKGAAAGTPLDVNGKPIMDSSKPGVTEAYISDAPDSNTLLSPIPGAKANSLSLVTHYEYDSIDLSGKSAYGYVPASISITELEQNMITGELRVKKIDKLNDSAVGGIWIPCAGSQSPWNTHLGSEEYEPDARQFEKDQATTEDKTQMKAFSKYYFGDEKKANVYNYGHITEVTVDKDGKSSIVKHYAMGRLSFELGRVMPDQKTVYYGDDGTNTMLFMYVADKAKDLSAGTLYAAKWKQTSDANGGAATLEWISLGKSSDAEIKSFIDKGMKFSDIFEAADKETEGFTRINTYNGVEFLKLKPGMEKAAAFLESRRYGALLGATSEFSKMEGVANSDKHLFLAMSRIEKGMLDSAGKEPVDHIKLPALRAGVTFASELTKGIKDSKGNSIASDYVAADMKGLVVGEDLKGPDAYGNTANVEKVANPDNLSYSEKLRTLFIGEDSGMHTNNFVWAYQVDTGKLTRILTVTAGAEATGLQFADDRNGFSYMMSNYQHPGDELLEKKIVAVDKQKLYDAIEQEVGVNRFGKVGYVKLDVRYKK
ncbi:MAG: PhoX family protein [Bacilli bacterium]